MNFSLEHFELHFSTDLLASGEQLYDSGAIRHSEEIEKNLWSYEIKDGERYEIEILISPSRVLNYSCECSEYKANKACRHIIAALFHLRLQKTKKVRQKPTVQIQKYPSKLSISGILNQIPPQDLKNFIRSYAKKNKHFSTALKANFARKIDLQDNEEKYETILNGIIKPATDTDYRISPTTIKNFIAIADQFEAQFEDAVSLKQFKEAFFILKSILSKTAYINHWTLSEREDIASIIYQFHEHFKRLLHMDIPPSLRAECIEFGLELSERSYYHITHPTVNMIAILSFREDEEILKNTIRILHQHIKKENLHNRELELLWMIRQKLSEKAVSIPELKAPLISSQGVYRICDFLMAEKAYLGLKKFLELFKSPHAIKDLYLLKKYTRVLSIMNDRNQLWDVGMEALIAHMDIYFYNLLTKEFPEQKEEIFLSVKDKLLRRRTYASEVMYLEILMQEEKTEDLMVFVQESKFALTHLFHILAYLEKNSDESISFTTQVVESYLEHFLGRESALEMRKLLVHCRNLGLDKLFTALKHHMSTEYSKRKMLIDEIKDLRL